MTGKKNTNLQLFKGLLVSPFLLYIIHAATHGRLACDQSTVAMRQVLERLFVNLVGLVESADSMHVITVVL